MCESYVNFCSNRAYFIDDPVSDDALLTLGPEILQRLENVETFNRRSGHSNHLSCGKFTDYKNSHLNDFICVEFIECTYVFRFHSTFGSRKQQKICMLVLAAINIFCPTLIPAMSYKISSSKAKYNNVKLVNYYFTFERKYDILR